jgi:hypothetical protein
MARVQRPALLSDWKFWSALADDFRTFVLSQDPGCLGFPDGEIAVSGISA